MFVYNSVDAQNYYGHGQHQAPPNPPQSCLYTTEESSELEKFQLAWAASTNIVQGLLLVIGGPGGAGL